MKPEMREFRIYGWLILDEQGVNQLIVSGVLLAIGFVSFGIYLAVVSFREVRRNKTEQENENVNSKEA